MQIENKHFYNMESVVDLKYFIELLLVTLVNRDNIQSISRNIRINKCTRL